VWNHPMHNRGEIGVMRMESKNRPFLCGDIAIFTIGLEVS
jgi:hypothetical protein